MSDDKKSFEDENGYTYPPDAVEKHEGQESGFVSDRVIDSGTFNPLYPGGEEVVPGYVGVDPIYQNFASETEKPGRAESGPEADWEDAHLGEDQTEGYGSGDPDQTSAEGSADDGSGNVVTKPSGDASTSTTAKVSDAKSDPKK